MKDANWLEKLLGYIGMYKIGACMAFQILNYPFANKSIELSYENHLMNDNHCFTILTGKNGIGKSRLLVSIVSKYLKENNSNEILSKIEPNKIIAISNIKTDKFPIKRNKSEKYYYFGNKSNSPFQSNDRYSIFKNLLTNPQINEQSVSQTFNYLGFKSSVNIYFNFTRFAYPNNTNQFEKYLEIFELYSDEFERTLPAIVLDKFLLTFSDFMRNRLRTFSSYILEDTTEKNETTSISNNTSYFKKTSLSSRVVDNLKKNLNQNEILLLNCIYKLHSSGKNITFEIFNRVVKNTIFNSDLFIKNLNIFHDFRNEYKSDFFNDIIFMLSLELVTISDLKLLPNDSNNLIKFTDLSSGQQSLFNILLGISGVIEDNSLICIDEPEVNLHPEWQNEFILKLQNIFNCFYGCHFIIATHSPQIVSGLTSSKGFVVDLENNITYSADNQSKRSADFQLAKIFNSPGYNNEYILKICFHLLTTIKENKELSHEDLNFLKDLETFKKNLKIDDPSLYLIKQVQSFFG